MVAIFASGCLGVMFLAAQAAAGQPAVAQAAPQTSGESANELFVTAGKSVVVDSAVPIDRVSVGFGDYAEASAVSPREVLVNGIKPGQTSLIIWQKGGGKLFFDVTVEPSQFANDTKASMISKQLRKELPGQKINISVDNNLIFLRGTVKDLGSARRAMDIASAIGKPVDLLYVDVPPPAPQILLKVRFASVDRSRSRQLGMNLFSTGAARTIGSVTTQQFSPPMLSSGPSGGSSGSGGVTSNGVTATLTNALDLFFFRPDLNLGATIQALETRGVVQILAEPNLLAANGKEASFLAGGKFPYPVVQGGTVGGSTAVTIQFAQFGILLNFIPTITPRGTIRLQVAPEVSSLDYANGVTISGFTVPAIDVRNVNTEVELAQGQSFAIGGLLDNRETENFEKIPFLGDIPILGKFFQSQTRTKTNTELIVIVTPEIVRPSSAGHPIALPNFPVSFLPPNSKTPMSTPAQNVTGPVPVTPPTKTVPVETLIKSLQEQPLIVNSTAGNGGGYTMGQGPGMTAGGTSMGPGASAPAPTAPQ